MVTSVVDRISRRLADDCGSVLPFVAVMMLMLLGVAAFSVDLGNYYGSKRQLQNAADAAALAGAADLPSSTTSATTDANTYVSKNVTGATATVTTPYNSNGSQIKVSLSKTVGGIFGGVFGIGSETISASAVAATSSSGSTSSFFASDTTCSDNTINVNGNNIAIGGGVHSNGAFGQNGNNNSYGATTYGGPNGCSYSNTGNNNTFTSGPTVDSNTEPWPEDFSTNPPACTYSAASFTWNTSNLTLPSGVYCATGAMTINGNNITGSVTLIANSLSLNGNNLSLTPYTDGLLIYQKGTGALTVNGNNLVDATIFAPNATVVLNGNNGAGSGYVEAKDITVNGNNYTFTGDGPPVASLSGESLVQ
jgi:Flp pilus assembly protein TadG